jgi:hypothetical protein
MQPIVAAAHFNAVVEILKLLLSDVLVHEKTSKVEKRGEVVTESVAGC